MTRGTGATRVPHRFTETELAWIGEHRTELERSVSEQRILQVSLAIGFVVGLAAHVGGYLLKASAPPPGLLALVADLLYALGWALWTGVVVVVFVELIPETKRRQLKAALDDYDAQLRAQAGAQAGRRQEHEMPR